MSNLSERLQKARQHQQNTKDGAAKVRPETPSGFEYAPEDARYRLLVGDFDELLPKMTAHWGYGPDEVDYFETIGRSQCFIEEVVQMWMADAVVASLPLSSALQIRSMIQFQHVVAMTKVIAGFDPHVGKDTKAQPLLEGARQALANLCSPDILPAANRPVPALPPLTDGTKKAVDGQNVSDRLSALRKRGMKR